MKNAASSFGSPPAPASLHPDIDRWIAYHAGEVAEDDARNLQDHLAGCRACTALVLDLEAFAEPPGSVGAASEFEKAAVWRALKPELETRRGGAGRLDVPATLAAALLLAVVGSGLGWQQHQLSELRQRSGELLRPQPNVPIHDLYPRSAVRGGTPPEAALARPAAAIMTLVLNSLEPAPGTLFRARIVDGGGRERLTVDGLTTDEMGVVTFGLARDALAAGDYLVRLEKAHPGGWSEHEVFALEIRDSGLGIR